MYKRGSLPVLLACVCIIGALAAALPLFAPAHMQESVSLLSWLRDFHASSLPYYGLLMFGAYPALAIISGVLLVWATILVLSRRSWWYWWLLPGSAVLYGTMFLFSQLHIGSDVPSWALQRLATDARIGQWFIALVILLELAVGALLLIFSARIGLRMKTRRNHRQREAKVSSETRSKTLAQRQNSKPKQSYQQRKEAWLARKEFRRANQWNWLKRLLHKSGESSKKKSVDQTKPVALVSSTETVHGAAPVPSDLQEDQKPLYFEMPKPFPRMKKIGKICGNASDDTIESGTPVVPAGVYVGTLRIEPDDSMTLTGSSDCLMQDDSGPKERLLKRFEEESKTSAMVVPRSVPRKNRQKAISPSVQDANSVQYTNTCPLVVSDPLKISESSAALDEELPHASCDDTPTEDCSDTKADHAEQLERVHETPQSGSSGSTVSMPAYVTEPGSQQKEEVADVSKGDFSEAEDSMADGEADMELLSGIGGLVSSNAGSSALLTRKHLQYQIPPEDLLVSYPDHSTDIDDSTRRSGENLVETLRQFRIEASLMNIVKGPTVTMFEVSPAPGVRVSSITSLSDNIALQLAARQVRIVAPIPGKQAVGIEVPNKVRSIIGFREMLPSIDAKDYQIPMVLGRKITGEPVVIDLAQTPHLLIAGATGSGKSVCVNSLICSILYRRSPKDVRMILVDPKIVELRVYNGIPHLLTPVITEPKKTIKALEFCLYEMDRRYKLLNALAVRNITAYNTRIKQQRLASEKLPYIVVVIDEFADLMTTVGKELETLLARLAAMARAVGIHLVLATQRPSANVITGIIKSNIPTRIAFMVASQIDSRIIIDESGAEKLLGKGDMLFAPGWDPHSVRIQGAFLSDEEVEAVVGFAKTQGEPDYLDEMFFEDDDDDRQEDEESIEDDDTDEALMEKALRIVVERQSASASYLQRRLKIGYNRAARLVEQMEADGYVGPARGSKPRELLRYPD